jgi:hypothetical protein
MKTDEIQIDRHKLEDHLRGKELLAQRRFSHPGDWYLIMVLIAQGEGAGRQYVTWYFNTDSGGFNEGHYFDVRSDPDAEINAHIDFWERCKRYCSAKRAGKPSE